MFRQVSSHPDFVSLEHEVLKFWEDRQCFEKLRRARAAEAAEVTEGAKEAEAGRLFSFIDGPITANNPMGVHHAWGRTYKDIYQRYKAMQGYHQRYQNGFDCQGLWVEVEVEKSLKLNSKRDIREYGLARFVGACRERVLKFAAIQTAQSKRLGQWMDWDNSYYTMADDNMEHIWYFLHRCHEKGWLYRDQRVMPWCIRCGTSLSQHELLDSYKEVEHDTVFVALPLTDAPDTHLLVWTTTPWTLPANVAVAVHPEAAYVQIEQDGKSYILAAEALSKLTAAPYHISAEFSGSALLGKAYIAPFADLPVQKQLKQAHTIIAWSEVDPAEGTGLVHIAPGCGAEDHELGQRFHLPRLCPIDEDGVFVAGYGSLTGVYVKEAKGLLLAQMQQAGVLYKTEKLLHRYPHCWRCGEELVFRLENEWFISAEEIRPHLIKAAASVTWLPDFAGKMMQDWLTNMGDWCISRKRFWGLPLPFYPCTCGHLTVVKSGAELEQLSGRQLQENRLHRPWIDEITITCPSCGQRVKRISEVGDCWLDAGVVPYSTLRYLSDRQYWQKWFPADLVVEMREQIRLWFYSMLFMSVTLEGCAPYRRVMIYEKVHDEHGRPMHKSWGNAIWFDEAVERMGADVMRWIYASHSPTITLNFGYRLADEVRRKLLTLWHVYSFFTTYANIDGWQPAVDEKGRLETGFREKRAVGGHGDVPLLDRWLEARRRQYFQAVRKSMDAFDVQAAMREHESFLDDLSNWYVRRSRRRFWKNENDADKESAYETLYQALLTMLHLLAPILPFITEHMYQNLVRSMAPGEPESIHLCRLPEDEITTGTASAADAGEMLLEQMKAVREVVNLGLAARNRARIRIRQPLPRLAVSGVDSLSHDPELIQLVQEELNVKEVQVLPAAELSAMLTGEAPPWIVERIADICVALDPTLTPQLVREGWARDLVRHIQQQRKESGLSITERICLTIAGDEKLAGAVEEHGEYIKRETLAEYLRWDGKSEGLSELKSQAAKQVSIGGLKAIVTMERL